MDTEVRRQSFELWFEQCGFGSFRKYLPMLRDTAAWIDAHEQKKGAALVSGDFRPELTVYEFYSPEKVKGLLNLVGKTRFGDGGFLYAGLAFYAYWLHDVAKEELIRSAWETVTDWPWKFKSPTIRGWMTGKSSTENALGHNDSTAALRINEKHQTSIARGDAACSVADLGKGELKIFRSHLAAFALQYDEYFVRRFFAALQAKRFVVLTGLSGSGKTQLALQFCEMFAAGRHAVVPVGADWTNNEKMLGYPDAMKPGRYVKPETGVLDLVLKAAKDPEHSYVLVLDEMNLSHVERYFADFLSAMESKGELKLHGEKGDLDGVPPTVRMPENLWVIGTMNVDETTYMFSPKVLDRAQVLEFRVKAGDMAQFLEGKQADAAAALKDFFPELAKVGAEFGYRTAGEFCSFVENAIKLGCEAEEAVDAAIMQKLLPKLHGSRRQLEKPLTALWKLCLKDGGAASVETLAKVEGEIDSFPYATNCRYPISAEKIARLFKNAKDNGFASYAEA